MSTIDFTNSLCLFREIQIIWYNVCVFNTSQFTLIQGFAQFSQWGRIGRCGCIKTKFLPR